MLIYSGTKLHPLLYFYGPSILDIFVYLRETLAYFPKKEEVPKDKKKMLLFAQKLRRFNFLSFLI